jgi:hypothetical protein
MDVGVKFHVFLKSAAARVGRIVFTLSYSGRPVFKSQPAVKIF